MGSPRDSASVYKSVTGWPMINDDIHSSPFSIGLDENSLVDRVVLKAKFNGLPNRPPA